jgi:hypothetical protein
MLKSTSKVPPGGWSFYEPRTDHTISQPSFQQLVIAVAQHRLSNRRFEGQWSTDLNVIGDEIHDQIGNRVVQRKKVREWPDWWSDDVPPKPPGLSPRQSTGQPRNPLVATAANLAAGIGLYVEWFGSGDTVPQEEADRRATICVSCPVHQTNPNFSDHFTDAAAGKIMAVFQMINKLNLHTTLDDKLGMCPACSCPMKAKVWAPLDLILKKIRPESKAELWKECWITNAKL